MPSAKVRGMVELVAPLVVRTTSEAVIPGSNPLSTTGKNLYYIVVK